MADGFDSGVLKLIRTYAASLPNLNNEAGDSKKDVVYMGEKRRTNFQAKGSIDWDDGCQYNGYFWGKLRQGYGQFRFDAEPKDTREEEVHTGCLVDGQWEDNKVHGYARVLCAGQFRLVQFDAAGTIVKPDKPTAGDLDDSWTNCCEYIGQFDRNLRHGLGLMVCLDGTELCGSWDRDSFVASIDDTSLLGEVVRRGGEASEAAQEVAQQARRLAYSARTQQQPAPPAPAPAPAAALALGPSAKLGSVMKGLMDSYQKQRDGVLQKSKGSAAAPAPAAAATANKRNEGAPQASEAAKNKRKTRPSLPAAVEGGGQEEGGAAAAQAALLLEENASLRDELHRMSRQLAAMSQRVSQSEEALRAYGEVHRMRDQLASLHAFLGAEGAEDGAGPAEEAAGQLGPRLAAHLEAAVQRQVDARLGPALQAALRERQSDGAGTAPAGGPEQARPLEQLEARLHQQVEDMRAAGAAAEAAGCKRAREAGYRLDRLEAEAEMQRQLLGLRPAPCDPAAAGEATVQVRVAERGDGEEGVAVQLSVARPRGASQEAAPPAWQQRTSAGGGRDGALEAFLAQQLASSDLRVKRLADKCSALEAGGAARERSLAAQVNALKAQLQYSQKALGELPALRQDLCTLEAANSKLDARATRLSNALAKLEANVQGAGAGAAALEAAWERREAERSERDGGLRSEMGRCSARLHRCEASLKITHQIVEDAERLEDKVDEMREEFTQEVERAVQQVSAAVEEARAERAGEAVAAVGERLERLEGAVDEARDVAAQGFARVEEVLREMDMQVQTQGHVVAAVEGMAKNVHVLELMGGSVHHNINDLRNEVEEGVQKTHESIHQTCESVVKRIVSPLVVDINSMKSSWDLKCNHLKMMENAVWESVVMHRKEEAESANALSPLQQTLAALPLDVMSMGSELALPSVFGNDEEEEEDEEEEGQRRPYNGAADGSGNIPPEEAESADEPDGLIDTMAAMVFGTATD